MSESRGSKRGKPKGRDPEQEKKWNEHLSLVLKLLNGGVFHCSELSKESGLSRTAIYGHLRELESLGKVEHRGRIWIPKETGGQPLLEGMILEAVPNCTECRRLEKNEEMLFHADNFFNDATSNQKDEPLVREYLTRNFLLIRRAALWNHHLAKHTKTSHQEMERIRQATRKEILGWLILNKRATEEALGTLGRKTRTKDP